jgi:hypothetical protein
MGSSSAVSIPIGTSDPIDLSSGLPLFRGQGSRAGIFGAARSYKLFDIPILIVCMRLKVSAYAGYGVGVVGPAIAFLSDEVTVARDNSGDEGQLTLTFNRGLQMQAGAFLGAYVSAGVNAALEVYLPRPWYKVWAWTWQTVFTITAEFKIDLLALMSDLIGYLLARKPNAASFTKARNNILREVNFGVESFIMEGSSSGVRPDLRATPEVTAPLNLASYVPKLREINLALAKVDGGVSFGPTPHLQFPVTFNFDGFTVEGGVQRVPSADYGDVHYRNHQVTARGNTRFNLNENPSRFTTHVRYQTSVKLAISIHAEIKVAKFFSLSVNSPSLDLTYLLLGQGIPISDIRNSVSTSVGGGCVLTPNMTLRFEGDHGLKIQTGDHAGGTVTLVGFRSDSAATVTLEIEPPDANFPTRVTIAAGANSASFRFTFQNRCLATGNRNNPSETAPPSPISALQTYRVRATLDQRPEDPCSDYQAEAPLSITNRFLRCQRFASTFGGPPPPWDPLASATIDAAVDNSGAPTGSFQVLAVLWFPYVVPNEQPQTVPITFTLLDENRQPYGRADVDLLSGNERRSLTPSCTLNVTLLREGERTTNSNLTIQWKSRGPVTGYGNRFYLLVNGGCRHGQNEFWLDVFNWS